MKNIHLLPTDKPSRLYTVNSIGKLDWSKDYLHQIVGGRNQHIYITSDEEIKEGVDQWYLDKVLNEPYNSGGAQYSSKQDVIILTTDQDLIKDGVQAIDDEFLEWFVKNPSCEEIKINYEIYKEGVGLLTSDWRMSKDDKYKIIIPKEEPKQETLEEAAERCNPIIARSTPFGSRYEWIPKKERKQFINGAKWQQERSYSEEEVFQFFEKYREDFSIHRNIQVLDSQFKEWFEQFKKQ